MKNQSGRRTYHHPVVDVSRLAWLLDPELSHPRQGERRRDTGIWRIDPLRGDRRRNSTPISSEVLYS